MKLTKLEDELLDELLEQIYQQYSCAGCNDYRIPATDEGKKIATQILEKQGESLELIKEIISDPGEIIVSDSATLRYLMAKLRS